MNLNELIINKIINNKVGIGNSIPTDINGLYEFIKSNWMEKNFINFDNPNKYFSNYHLYNYFQYKDMVGDSYAFFTKLLENLEIKVNDKKVEDIVLNTNCELSYNTALYVYNQDNSDIHIPFYLEALKLSIISLKNCKDQKSIVLYNKMIHKMKKILETLYVQDLDRISYKELHEISTKFINDLLNIENKELPHKKHHSDDTITTYNLDRFKILFERYNCFLYFREKFEEISYTDVLLSQAIRKVEFYLTDLLEVIYKELKSFQVYLMKAHYLIHEDLEKMIILYMEYYYNFMDTDVADYIKEDLAKHHSEAMNSNYMRQKIKVINERNEKKLLESGAIEYIKNITKSYKLELTELYNKRDLQGIFDMKTHIDKIKFHVIKVLKFYHHTVTNNTAKELRDTFTFFKTIYSDIDYFIKRITKDDKDTKEKFNYDLAYLKYIFISSSNNTITMSKILSMYNKLSNEKILLDLEKYQPVEDVTKMINLIEKLSVYRDSIEDEKLIILSKKMLNLMYMGLAAIK